MYGNSSTHRQPPSFGMGGGGTPPRDFLILLAVVFVTFSLQYFTPGLIALLRLSPDLWQRGFLWQAITYPFAGTGQAGIWFLLSLLILFWFGRDVRRALGRRQFWVLLVWGTLTAAAVAVATYLLQSAVGFQPALAFNLMQGQTLLLTIVIAAFATLYSHATIHLFFVLPIQAKWFLGLEILFAFMGYLSTKDLPGFLGICAAVGITWSLLSGRGGPGRLIRRSLLRLQQAQVEARLRKLRRQRGFKVVQGDKAGPSDGSRGRRGNGKPWVN